MKYAVEMSSGLLSLCVPSHFVNAVVDKPKHEWK
jgi:hypothetical protein